MAESRSIKVTFTADVSQYVEAMEKATLATSTLAAELRAVGISEADIPAAIKTVLKLVRHEDPDDGMASARVR